MNDYAVALAAITLLAAIVNGALGYGFSSITVPIALLFLANRVLNPALVLIEVVLNAYVLWNNREAVHRVARRAMPVIVGLVPGVVVGTAIVSQVNPAWLRFVTFIVLLPLILFQAAGYRRPIRSERSAWLVFGSGLGVLYSVTTISGPPLAIMLNNQGFAKKDFRAALGIIRLAESSMTAVAYAYAGLFTMTSMSLIPWIVPSILVGVPIGSFIIHRMNSETFRRICMSFDAWVVAFGISRLLQELEIVQSGAAYLVLVGVVLLDVWLLYRFFSAHSVESGAETASFPAVLPGRLTVELRDTLGSAVPSRPDCPHCGVIGRVSAERIIHARGALTTYYCDACRSEWDETETGGRIGTVRTRPPKTYRDKTE